MEVNSITVTMSSGSPIEMSLSHKELNMMRYAAWHGSYGFLGTQVAENQDILWREESQIMHWKVSK